MVRALINRVGNCVEMTTLFLLAARVVGFKAKAVSMPQHVFVRIRCEDGYTNVESTILESNPTSDDEYAKRITSMQRKKGIYLRDLSDNQFLAIILHKIVCADLHAGKSLGRKNMRVVRDIIEYYPTMTDTYNSLGINYMMRAKNAWSENWIRRGLAFDSDSQHMCENLVQALILQGKYKEAAKTAESNINKFNVTHAESSFQHLLVITYCRMGNYERAVEMMGDLITSPVSNGSRQQMLLPYTSCLFYFTGEFMKSAEFANTYASLGKENEIGVVWVASALRRLGLQRKMTKLVRQQIVTDYFLQCVINLMLGEYDQGDLTAEFSDRKFECECYLGEYWACLDIGRALQHWKNCLELSDKNTFEHLRSSRNYQDNLQTQTHKAILNRREI